MLDYIDEIFISFNKSYEKADMVIVILTIKKAIKPGYLVALTKNVSGSLPIVDVARS